MVRVAINDLPKFGVLKGVNILRGSDIGSSEAEVSGLKNRRLLEETRRVVVGSCEASIVIFNRNGAPESRLGGQDPRSVDVGSDTVGNNNKGNDLRMDVAVPPPWLNGLFPTMAPAYILWSREDLTL